MIEVLVATTTGLLALLTTIMVELIRRTGKVVTQVQNGHKGGPSLRDDIADISKKVDQIHRDLAVEREDRRDLARAHYALADVVYQISRECPLAARLPATNHVRPPDPVVPTPPDPPAPPGPSGTPPPPPGLSPA